jgi:hypothetical protein
VISSLCGIWSNGEKESTNDPHDRSPSLIFERRFHRDAGSGRVVNREPDIGTFATKSAPALPEDLDDAKVRDSPADQLGEHGSRAASSYGHGIR